MKTFKKTTSERMQDTCPAYDPNSRQSLYRSALLAAAIGAIAYYLSIHYHFVRDYSYYLFRGAWALIPLIYLPWMVVIGEIISRALNADKTLRSVFGTLGALSVACLLYKSTWGFNWAWMYQNVNYSIFYSSLICVMVGAFSMSNVRSLSNRREYAILSLIGIIAMAIYLLCDYLLNGHTSPVAGTLLGTTCIALFLAYTFSIIVVSFCIACFCRSQIAIRLTKPLLVRILLIILCAEPSLWQVVMASYGNRWDWTLLLPRVMSPLVVLTVYLVIRLIKCIRAKLH